MLLQIIDTADEMLEFSDFIISNGKTIGFVPTMGALHEGHATLIKQAKAECDVIVVSVFVNPTQFNDKSDLENYPRTFDADKQLLDTLGVDVMFYPSASEIYPNGTQHSYNLDGLDAMMEGPKRPGHFNGVVQVVMRLFDLTRPTMAYFGEKDFQQLAIISHMTKKLGYSTKIIGCPTIREENGLAMSSRNRRLSVEGRKNAAVIFSVLQSIERELLSSDLAAAKKKALSNLSSATGLELEYLEFVNPNTLQLASDNSESIQACIAAWIEGVRLIDNLRVK